MVTLAAENCNVVILLELTPLLILFGESGEFVVPPFVGSNYFHLIL